MTRLGMRVLAVLVLAAPAGLIADDKKETPEKTIENHDSKTKGAVQVMGETKEWFDVAKNGKSILTVPKLLNGTLELEPGEYEVLVNRTSRKVTIEAGKKVVFATGTLKVEGEGLNFYALDGKTKLVAPNANPPGMNRSTALFPGTYAVEVNQNLRKTVVLTEKAKIEPGKKTTLKK
jgi:hypothetical protein